MLIPDPGSGRDGDNAVYRWSGWVLMYERAHQFKVSSISASGAASHSTGAAVRSQDSEVNK